MFLSRERQSYLKIMFKKIGRGISRAAKGVSRNIGTIATVGGLVLGGPLGGALGGAISQGVGMIGGSSVPALISAGGNFTGLGSAPGITTEGSDSKQATTSGASPVVVLGAGAAALYFITKR